MKSLDRLSLSEKLLAIGYDVPPVVLSSWASGNHGTSRLTRVNSWLRYKLKVNSKSGRPPKFPEFLKPFRVKEDHDA